MPKEKPKVDEKIRKALHNARGFEIDDESLGQGAFGQVLKATKDGKTYAIKSMLFIKEMLKYQKRELTLLVKMRLSEESERNVIKYFDSWGLTIGNEQRMFIQMELCSVDLKNFVYETEIGPKMIRDKGWPRFYQQVFQQILNGLIAIHSINWVHRDIHPGNILIVNPDPKRICDINVKIADFGRARKIADIEFDLSPGQISIIPKLEDVTVFGNGYFSAPELLSTKYDSKVDVYSVGVVLYFISRYLDDKSKWTSELEAVKQHIQQNQRNVDLSINKCLDHNDDEKLRNQIINLLQVDPNKRRDASQAREYMFPTPTEANDSTDASGATTTEFHARRDDEEDFYPCTLKAFTLSALKEEIENHTCVEAGRQILRQERMISGEKQRVKITCDEHVKNIFRSAAEHNRDVVVVVTEKYNEPEKMISESESA